MDLTRNLTTVVSSPALSGQTTDAIRGLLEEFREVGLTDVDARRAAFCALTWHRGWPSARIARYLGISRARVGQRVEKLRQYTQTRDMPILTSLLDVERPDTEGGGGDPPVAFEPDSWRDGEFAAGLLELAAA